MMWPGQFSSASLFYALHDKRRSDPSEAKRVQNSESEVDYADWLLQWVEHLSISFLSLCDDGSLLLVLGSWSAMARIVGLCFHHL
jgi:hypothetical protein